MKNQSTGYGDKRKKGFYTSLAAGGGAVLVLALVISFSNLTTVGPDPQQFAYEQAENEETVMAGADYTLPYLAQADLDQALFRPRSTPSPSPDPSPNREPNQETPASTTPREVPSPSPDTERTPDTPASTIPQEAPAPSPENEAAPDTSGTSPTTENEPSVTPEAAPPQPTTEPTASFDPFTEGDQMIWPVYGDIAMVFSQDQLIYNPTLDQWRTNDDLRISAQEGTPVRAAAAGRVTEVGSDRVYGNFIRVDNGNGWETIYGQLMDGILVVQGDVVQAGQVIGGVGRPSVFSVLNGHHVSLRVLHEDSLMDPKLLLAAQE
ncbi:MAG: peptidoglycan DD-metalloendopeptidase family protein [Defluviitaleaceae bacterium]|nr:peptidoglycan DD-metalloendopeptidase family protein [Defluviitaleaceae bacterium]